jgi:hypothetical protein
MWNNPTHAEWWEVEYRTTSAQNGLGQGSLVGLAPLPEHVRRRHEIASSYRASLRRSRTTARARLSQFLGTTYCAARSWYAQRYQQEWVVGRPC